MEWITDRRPTEADGDHDGDVLLRLRPGYDRCSYCHFSLVGEGSHWCHSEHWQPAPAPEPQLDVRVGQVWRRRNGTIAIVTEYDGSDAPFLIGGYWYRRNGQFYSNSPRPEYDLVELIENAPRPVPEVSLQLADEPEPAPLPVAEQPTHKVIRQPRRFMSISRTIAPDRDVLDAIDDEGVAWWMVPGETWWQRLAALPAREVQADA
jgi:hypothetical protein